MCFSAEASFAVGAALLPAGIYCTTVAVRRRPSYLPLAIVPLVFSFQQVAEGLVWVGLGRGDDSLVRTSSLMFLATALAFWPFWVPFSVLVMEGRRRVRQCLAVGALVGLAFGCALFVPLALNTDEWLKVGEVYHSIRYNLMGLPAFEIAPHSWWDGGYAVIVLTPLFIVSPDRRFTLFSVMVAASAALSLFAFWYAFVSVWCFFAAVLSLQLCYIFYKLVGPCNGPTFSGAASAA
jgi:Family of unknown function (DUF6629)